MLQFTGKAERNMHAVDDGHDACVWALIDLMGQVSTEAQRAKPRFRRKQLEAA
jgi:hypothetical protein